MENPYGLRPVFSKAEAVAALTAPLADESYIMRANIKAYPCLATGQAIVAAGLEINRQIGGDPERLAHVRVVIADMPFLVRQKDDPGRINPTSREAADHSFNFLAAVSILDGEFGLAQFDNERWNDPKVRAVMGKLDIAVDAELTKRSPGSFPCRIEAKGTDGKTYLADVPDPPGFSRHGLEEGAVTRKFNAVTAPHLTRPARERIIEAAMTLDARA
jgi:2-methylcitrate dehydratase